MLKNAVIRTFSNKEVSYQEFMVELRRLDDMGLDVYVGTDSQVINKKISIATCICFYKPGINKNKVFYIKKRIPEEKHPSLRARMLLEAYTSLQVAMELDQLVTGALTVHLDVGSDAIKNKTSKFSKELRMLIESQGFGCEIKPNSWASSSVADKYTKS